MATTQEKTGLVGEFRERLQKRAEELKPAVEEHNEIRDALERLDMKEPQPEVAQDGAGSRRGRPRGGARRDQFLALVQEEPGITITKAAEKMGLKQANYLYRISSQLEKEKVIKKDGSGFVPVG